MKKSILSLLLLTSYLSPLSCPAQPRYDLNNLKREQLDRGVVALRDGGKVVVSWRTLKSDGVGEPFDVYRNGQKLNDQPLTKGGTMFIDEQPLTTDAMAVARMVLTC